MSVLIAPGIWIVAFGMRRSEGMTLFRRVPRYKTVEHIGMRLRISPIERNVSPLRPETFPVNVCILNDQSLDSFWIRQDDSEADRAAVVVEIEHTFADLKLSQEFAGCLREMIESV